MAGPEEGAAGPRRELGLFDSVCIIVGIIVGSGIFGTPSIVAGCVPGPWGVIGVWIAGGLLSLAGALCYAELAGAYPRQGGECVYLARAFGRWAGHLFGWAEMFVIIPGGIASVSLIFADYFGPLAGLPKGAGRFVAAGAVAALTAVNLAGVRQGKWTQNVLTVVKAAGLLMVGAVALFARGAAPSAGSGSFSMDGLGLALILVLFTYGGWRDIVFVAAEVRDPRRNFVRTMLAGVGAVTALYVLVNAAFLKVLGPVGMGASKAVAVDTVAAVFPAGAERVVAALVCLSALGSANGLVFTGARVSYAMGTGHRPLGFLGLWHPRRGVPPAALIVQGLLSVAVVLALGSFAEAVLYSTPVVWTFYFAAGASVFILRRKDPGVERPYRVTAYPVTPVLFCASCAYLVYSSVTYAVRMKYMGPLVAIGVVLAGLLFYGITEGRRGAVPPGPDRGP